MHMHLHEGFKSEHDQNRKTRLNVNSILSVISSGEDGTDLQTSKNFARLGMRHRLCCGYFYGLAV